MEHYISTYERWCRKEDLEPELKQELQEIAGDPEAIRDRFYKNLEFGTAGMRGLMGAGTHRMNIYMVRRTTQGLANYILRQGTARQGVVIAWDSRRHSKDFALEAALVLANNGIKAFIFKEITATPLLSYAIRALNTTAGIVITASHNPKEYNGYKLYWSDGGQLTHRIADEMTTDINGIVDALEVLRLPCHEAEAQSLLQWLGDGILKDYLWDIKQTVLNPEVLKQYAAGCRIVYTPFHGTGLVPVREALAQAGFTDVHVVEAQAAPDPEFPTVQYPNPEDPKAFAMAFELAGRIGADLVLGTDPDADRLGAAVKDAEDVYCLLTGNQIGALMIDYILQSRARTGRLPEHGVIVKTIVTSSLGAAIASSYGVGCIDVLTGFKYIGEKIKEFEDSQAHDFLFGYEESNGFLIHSFVRDKDSVQAALLMAEMAAACKSRGICLLERLDELFRTYGYYKEDQISFSFEGIEGQEKIARIMSRFRDRDPGIFSGLDAVRVKDYWLETEDDLRTGVLKKTELPKADVIHVTLADGSWIAIRPSGTEPKLKIYMSVKADSAGAASEKLEDLEAMIKKTIE